MAVAGGLLAVASWSLPGAAYAQEPEPEPECVGFACLDENAITALVAVVALSAGVVAGRGLWGD